MNVLAIIPARSKSKGLKNKNIKLINGKPLLAYTIQSAIESNIFSNIVVSTDSQEYAEIAKEWGANVPYLRSDKLSGDNASSWDVVEDILEYYKGKGIDYDVIALLQPTSPLRKSTHITESYDMLISKKADSIISVTETDHSPVWTNTLNSDSSMENFIEKSNLNKPRQYLEKYYRINGAVYFIKAVCVKERWKLYGSSSYAFVMDKFSSIDIDDLYDFKFAEYLLNNYVEE